MTKIKRTVNLEFISVKTSRPLEGGGYQRGLFYKKSCKFCQTEFNAQRQDTAFCSPRCQKAYKRKSNLEQQNTEL